MSGRGAVPTGRAQARPHVVLGLVAAAFALAVGTASGAAYAVAPSGAGGGVAARAVTAVSPQSGDLPHFVDGADLLTSAEAAALEAELGRVSETHEADVVVVAVNSLEGNTATVFGENYFYYGPDASDPLKFASGSAVGYGLGEDRSGILLVVSPESREWALVTHGGAIEVFTDKLQSEMMAEVRPYLSAGNWEAAFEEFASQVDSVYLDAGRIRWGMIALVALGAALLGGLVPTTIWRLQLKSVKPARGARTYIDQASVVLQRSNDQLVSQHTTVTDTRPPSGGGGGRSSSHIGAGGSRFGGSSGRF
ncbi:MAG: TPM domain-containing protein [Bifidobacteriaceae bacterium]|nr:TPM domain-containing protein [Bifidobacteriaceae bacterium]